MREVLRLGEGLEGSAWLYSRPNPSLRMHRHDELELNLVLRGQASYLVKDQRYELRPGVLTWLFPGQDHFLLGQSPDYAMWIAVFRPNLLKKTCSHEHPMLLESDPPGHHCRRVDPADARSLAALLEELAASDATHARRNAGFSYALLTAWEAYLEAADQPGGHGVHPSVERAARLLRDEAEPIALAELAQRCGLSPARLSRLFKQQTGVALVRYRQRQSLDRFLRLYGDGRRLTMMEAALRSGFGSYPQFHRVFRQHMGCSPADYHRRPQAG